ncbi:hypothetical protein [Streptomyces sp. NPDC060333]|uniref:hypothetical protein n=1 Tax=Streptomyces sp. NPDC060333 TaxID=3347098 RepID=UPI003666FF43
MTKNRRSDVGTPTPVEPRDPAERPPSAPDGRPPLLAVGGAAPLALLLVCRGRGHRR